MKLLLTLPHVCEGSSRTVLELLSLYFIHDVVVSIPCVCVLSDAGLPAELPKFQHKRQLGEVSERTLQGDDDGDEWHVRSASSSLSSAAAAGDAVMSASRSVNDSSMLDIDMDET